MKKLFYILLFLLPALSNAQPDSIPHTTRTYPQNTSPLIDWHPFSDFIYDQDPSYKAEGGLDYFHFIPHGSMAGHYTPLGGISLRSVFRINDSPFAFGYYLDFIGTHTQNYSGSPYTPCDSRSKNITAFISTSWLSLGGYGKIYLCDVERTWIKPFVDYQLGITMLATDLYLRNPPNVYPAFGKSFNSAFINFKGTVYAGCGISLGFPISDDIGMCINPSIGFLYGGPVTYPDVTKSLQPNTTNLDFIQWRISISVFGE